ncbi:MAG TPA: hypothetical protein VK154_11075 [Chitinophagales bacterium]|nr:hypothetical protein [Chitinophagales bacterium]
MKLFTITVLVLFCVLAAAQAPQQMNYQAVVRNGAGNPVAANTPVVLRFTIHDTAPGGAVVFTETQTDTTNEFGLVNLQIGQLGNLAIVDWSTGSKYLQVEADINATGTFTDMGASQLISVPYALYAANSTPGPPGPQGPAGSGNISGTLNYIAKFTPDGSSVGNSLAYDNGTNIGIATTNPIGRLDIRAKSNTTYPQLLIYDDSITGSGRIQFQNAGGNKNWQMYAYMHTSIAANSRFNFWNSVNGDVVSITGEGRLGVGTNMPNVKLHVHETSAITSFQLTNNQTGVTTSDGTLISQQGNDFVINNFEGGNLLIKNYAFERMRISNDGRFGIGDTQLLYKLTVKDASGSAANATAGYFTQTGTGSENAAIRAINSNSQNASSYGLYAKAVKGYGIYAVAEANSAYGVYGINTNILGYGVAGTGPVGVYAETTTAGGAALEINGAVKVVGGRFVYQTNAITVANPTLPLIYANQSSTDMLFVTPVNDIANHINTSVATFWNGSNWEIQSGTNLFPVGVKFNVMVIKR